MTIAASGAVSFSDLRSEFVGGSGAVSFSDLYRGGSNILAKSANNTGVNLAASVPASGTINFTNFRSTAKGFRYTYTAGATNQNASSLFGDDYSVNYPKEIVIDSGVELGATSTAEEALQIDSGASGTITVTNNGTLTGAGGSAGAAGGDAFQADTACTFINNGTIRSGGGGGGAGGNGGTGGNGSFNSTQTEHLGYCNCWPNSKYYNQTCNANNAAEFWYFSTNIGANGCGNNCTWNVGGWIYASDGANGCGTKALKRYRTVTNSTTGGAGGAGGGATVGRGYNQSAGSAIAGAGGAAGGTNAGTGGTGGSSGAGGDFGTAGSNGNTGATGGNGNVSGGAAGTAGASGGAAGAAIQGISNVTLTNNGTITGGQV